MYGYIYLTTNILNNKIYIGQHKANSFEPEKYIGSGVILDYAIKKYGIDSFKNELLVWCETAEELNLMEKYYIDLYNSTNRTIGYNIQSGGLANVTTTKGHVWITKDGVDHLIDNYFLEEYLDSGWQLGRSHEQVPWNKDASKENNKVLTQISNTRKEKIANGEIRCCYGLKGADSPNWKTDEFLIKNYLEKGFKEIWTEYGKGYACKYFKIKNTTFDRIMTLAGLEETPEHKRYIYNKNKKHKN